MLVVVIEAPLHCPREATQRRTRRARNQEGTPPRVGPTERQTRPGFDRRIPAGFRQRGSPQDNIHFNLWQTFQTTSTYHFCNRSLQSGLCPCGRYASVTHNQESPTPRTRGEPPMMLEGPSWEAMWPFPGQPRNLAEARSRSRVQRRDQVRPRVRASSSS